MPTDYYDRIIDFRPAPDGWRIIYLLNDASLHISPLPGWLITEQIEYDTRTMEDVGDRGTRSVIAAVATENELLPVCMDGPFWCVLGPGQVDPTTQETAKELERRAAEKARHQATPAAARQT